MKNTLRFLKKLTPMLALAAIMMAPMWGWGQIAAWQLNGAAGAETSINASTINSNLNTSTLSRGSGLNSSSLANAFSATNFTNNGDKANAISANKFMLFTINAKTGYKVSLSTLDVKFRRSGTGPNAFRWQYSIDGTNFTDIGSDDISFISTNSNGAAQTQINLSGITALQNVTNPTTITIRLLGWGATAAAGTFAIGRSTTTGATDYSLAIGGTVDAASGNTITLTPATQNFGPFCNSTSNPVALTYTTAGTVTSPFVQLSNSSGSFASGTSNLGGTISGSGSYTITADIPASQGAGNYRVKIVSTDATPVVSADNGSNITVNAAVTPEVSINDPGTICNNQSVTFTPVPTNLGGGTASYSWTIDGSPGAATGAAYTQNSWTQGNTVQAVMTVSGGCVTASSASSNIVTPTVTSPVTPAVSIAITAGSIPSCSGASVTFTATPSNLGGGSVSTYQWKVNGDNVGTNLATYTSTALADNDQVTCEIAISGGCVTSSSAVSTAISMSITALPATPTAGNDGPVCAGTTLNLTSNATGTISWTGPNSFTSAVQNPTISNVTASAAGTYSVTSNDGGCTSLAGTTTVVINTAPVITTHPASVSLTTGGSHTFSVVATGAGLTYQWKLNGTDINLATSSTYQVTNVTTGMSGNSYTCVVSGTCAPPVTSNAAILTVNDLPCGGGETFTNSNLTNNSSSGSFTGDVVTWSYVSCRDQENYGITGKGCMFTSSSAKITSGNLSGIGNFTCKLKKGFTGAGTRQVSLYVNGIFKGSSIAWDNTTTHTFTVNNINISGNVVIEVRNATGYNAVVDDISWTCYSAPAAPTANNATNVSSTGFTANWSSVSGAISYRLDVSPVNPFTSDVTVVNENFVNCPNQTGTNIAANLNAYLNLSGWTGSQIYPAGGEIRLGSGSNTGIITTPTIDLSGGIITLSFDLRYYDANTTVEVLHASDGADFVSVSTIVAPVSMTNRVLNISGGTINSKIRIQAVTAANQRYYLDNFIVVKTVNNSLAGYTDLSVSGISQAVTGLSTNAPYYYRVRAVGNLGSSANSNVIEVTTGGTKVSAAAGDWNTIAWSPAGTPTIADDVTINHAVTISATGTADCHNLTIGTGSLSILSDATGTGSLIPKGTVSGSVSIQRYITGGWSTWDDGWHQLSSPVAAQPISAFATVNYDFYGWAEPTDTWMNYKHADFNTFNGGTNFNVGQGYLVSYEAANTTQTFTGVLNTANVTKTDLSITSGKYSGWHLLGNPFASALAWNDGNWALNNVAGNAKIWHETNKSYSDIAANGIIPSAQGFMAQVGSSTNSITIPAVSRVHNAAAFYKSDDEQILLVAAETEGGSAQESKIIVNPMATEGFDFDYDSRFLAGYAPMLYSIVGDESLSTNSLPELASGKVIPLGFVKNAATAFTIELKESIPAHAVYLTDKKTDIVTNLSESPVYSFTSNEGDDANRFELKFGAVGIDDNIATKQTSIYSNGQLVYISSAKSANALINIYNVTGQQVYANTMVIDGQKQIALNTPTGWYIVKVRTQEGVATQKVFIKSN